MQQREQQIQNSCRKKVEAAKHSVKSAQMQFKQRIEEYKTLYAQMETKYTEAVQATKAKCQRELEEVVQMVRKS